MAPVEEKKVALVADRNEEEAEKAQALDTFVIPEDVETYDLTNLLFFSLGGINFCVQLTEIMSVIKVHDLLMDMDFDIELPPICKGFIRYQRQEVPLLDISQKFGKTTEEVADDASGLMVDFGVTFMGLLVDYVYNIEDVRLGYSLDIPAQITELGDSFLRKYIVYPNGGAYLLTIQEIFTDDDLEALSEIL
jgi:chemotaxis signal transduction protein